MTWHFYKETWIAYADGLVIGKCYLTLVSVK